MVYSQKSLHPNISARSVVIFLGNAHELNFLQKKQQKHFQKVLEQPNIIYLEPKQILQVLIKFRGRFPGHQTHQLLPSVPNVIFLQAPDFSG